MGARVSSRPPRNRGGPGAMKFVVVVEDVAAGVFDDPALAAGVP